MKQVRDDTHKTSKKIVQFSRPPPPHPPPLVQIRPKFFHPLDLARLLSNEPLLATLQITNQLKENMILR